MPNFTPHYSVPLAETAARELGYTGPSGDAGNDIQQALRGLDVAIINPGTVGAAHEVAIADTNLASSILRGATPLELGVPSETRLIITPIIRDELLATGGFTSAPVGCGLERWVSRSTTTALRRLRTRRKK